MHGHDDIDSVRIVRDNDSLIGKGIAYVLFKARESVLKALELHGVSIVKSLLTASSSL